MRFLILLLLVLAVPAQASNIGRMSDAELEALIGSGRDMGCIGITDGAEVYNTGLQYLESDDEEHIYMGADCIMKAAVADYAPAYYELAKLYHAGTGTVKSNIHAYKWARYALYKKAEPAAEIRQFEDRLLARMTPEETKELKVLLNETIREEYARVEAKELVRQEKELKEQSTNLKDTDPEKAREIEMFFQIQEEAADRRARELRDSIEKELQKKYGDDEGTSALSPKSAPGAARPKAPGLR